MERARIILERETIGLLLEKLRDSKEVLWAWQIIPGPEKARRVHMGTISDVTRDDDFFVFRGQSTKSFTFEEDIGIYIFSKKKALAFQVDSWDAETNLLICPLPNKMKQLTSEYFENIQLVEIENESANITKREFERKRPDKKKKARFQRTDGEIESSRVYDMSAGGMALLTKDPGDFEIGETLRMLDVGAGILNNPIIGEVVSVRQFSEDKAVFKVGIKFKT